MSQRDRGGPPTRTKPASTPQALRATPPLPYGISPPRGGEKESQPHPPAQARMSQRARNFLPPQSGGRCRGATEGGRPRAPGRYAPPQALRAPPLCLTASPPQGGEKKKANRIPPPKPGCRSALGIFSPRKAGGDVATRQRGAARAHQARYAPPRRCARPPLCLPASPPQGGGEKVGGRRHQGGRKSEALRHLRLGGEH